MKNSILTILFALILLSCGDKKPSTNLHLTGNIKGLQQGKLYIQKVKDTDWVAIETINIDGDSHFETNLDIKTHEMYFLYLDRGVTNSIDNRIQFFAEPGAINIETTLENYSYNASVTGTKNNQILAEHKEILAKFNNDNLDLTAARFEALKQNNPAKVDSIDKKQEKNTIKKYLYTVNFALNHRDCEAAPYIAITEIYDVNLKYLDTIQKSMAPKIAQSLYGKKLTALLADRKKNEQ
jgi:hypothetical protein